MIDLTAISPELVPPLALVTVPILWCTAALASIPVTPNDRWRRRSQDQFPASLIVYDDGRSDSLFYSNAR
jgi:hypothetical protein